MPAPLITIFVRHSEDCKFHDDELYNRCRRRKHLRWTQNKKQHRRKAGTRSWAEAEQTKRDLEDQLAGRTPEPKSDVRNLEDAIGVFVQDKKVQGVTPGVLAKYTLQL